MTSTSAAQLAGKFAKAATIIPRANADATSEAALVGKGIFIEAAVAAGLREGGKLPSSRGSKWTARYDVKGQVHATALLRYVGPVHWAFWGTRRHVIVARRLTTRTGARLRARRLGAMAAFGGTNRGAFGAMRDVRGGKKALAFAGSDGPKAYAFHPGMRGRNTWPLAKTKVAAATPAAYKRAHRSTLISAGFGR